jgi:hypothetical protein
MKKYIVFVLCFLFVLSLLAVDSYVNAKRFEKSEQEKAYQTYKDSLERIDMGSIVVYLSTDGSEFFYEEVQGVVNANMDL